MKNFGDPTTGSTLYVAIVGSIIFVVTVIFLEALYYKSEEDQFQEKVVAEVPRELTEVRAAQQALLTNYGYDPAYNEGQGRVWIPVEEAQAIFLREAVASANGETNKTELVMTGPVEGEEGKEGESP